MDDISNKTLAILVGIAIVISLIGLLNMEKGRVAYFTGAGTSGEGPVTFNATSELSILVSDSINWGDGRVNSDAPNATLDSSAGTVEGGSWTPIEAYIKITNDGTVNISVNVSAGENQNAEGLIGGTNPEFKIKAHETETGACAGTLISEWTSVPNSTETPIVICNLLRHGIDQDEFNVSARVVIPSDAEAGERNATLTFSASEPAS
ncbi:MAG TPA: hypothetical protein ENN30_02835 [Candidatus Woesearchaeota archaeon]|nr:hypothetical protein [Candidatus Woesearchaeota archaeon]